MAEPPELDDGSDSIESLRARVTELSRELEQWRTFVPPGHFYSPFPDLEEVRANSAALFDRSETKLRGIDLNEERQHELVSVVAEHYAELPFPEQESPDRRYYYDNLYYSYSDAIFLFGMMRHLKPKRILEIGSGYSSAAMLDTNELFLQNSVHCTFVDPNPERLLSLLRDTDHEAAEIIRQPVQSLSFDVFEALEPDDILFIDSTHVAKTGSDVNYLYFEVLPRLQRGVYVHIHDIHYPFEYVEPWVLERRGWNESYVLRAFLMFNREFTIEIFNTYLALFHESWFLENMPLCLRNPLGSIWLRRA